MMRYAALWLFSLSALAPLLLAGCGKGETLAVHAPYTRCPRPSAPVPAYLDPAPHVGGDENTARLRRSVDMLASYIGALNAAIDCYERQTADAAPAPAGGGE